VPGLLGDLAPRTLFACEAICATLQFLGISAIAHISLPIFMSQMAAADFDRQKLENRLSIEPSRDRPGRFSSVLLLPLLATEAAGTALLTMG